MALENRDIHDRQSPENFVTDAGQVEIDAACVALETAVRAFAAEYVAANPAEFTDADDALALLQSLDCVADAVFTVGGHGVGFWDGRVDHVFADGNAGACRFSDAVKTGLPDAVQAFDTALDNAVYDYEKSAGIAV